MKKIWAPWRLEYILGDTKKKSKKIKSPCVFCGASQGKPSPHNLVLYQGKWSYVIMNKYPYVNGHLMVIPYRHLGEYAKLNKEEHAEMGQLMDLSMGVLKKVFKAQGFNLGMNIGRIAGAGIEEHLHYHVVPRWSGDHNFLPVVGEVRILIEYLKKTYQRLIKEFSRSR